MSGLDGLGWPNPEDEPKPKTMSDTLETDAEVNELKSATTYNMVWAEFARKLERERDEAREKLKWRMHWVETLRRVGRKLECERDEAREQRDAVTLRLGNTQERMIDAEMQRDRLIKSVEPLKYWRDISECDCSNPLPQGGCLRCDLNRVLKTTNPNNNENTQIKNL